MLRFIIKREMRDKWSGLQTQHHETIDIDVPELEAVLLGGGAGEAHYDYRSLVDVECLPATPAQGATE